VDLKGEGGIKKSYFLIILGVLFLTIAIPRITFPDLDHGDEYSDANVLNAGENFVKFGFRQCYFLPLFEPQLDAPRNLYTHYPPLADIINGVIRVVFQTDSLRVFRGVSLLFSLLSIIFWYLFIKKFTGSDTIAFVSSLFYMFNPMFILIADSLHQSAYAEFLKSVILFIFIITVNSYKKRKILFLIFLWILLVIESLVTFEYIIYLSLFFILYRLFWKESKKFLSVRTICFLLSASLFGFILHFLQNVWYFGNFYLAFRDLKNIAVERILHSKDSFLPLSFSAWWKYVILRNFSLVFMFPYYVLLPLILFLWFIYNRLHLLYREKIKALAVLFLIFIICGISWYIAFPSHSLAHTFISFLGRHLLAVSSIGFTLAFYIIFSFLKEKKVYSLANVLGGGLVFFISIWGLLNTTLPLVSNNIKRAEEFIKFKRCLLKIREMSGDKDTIGVNYFRFPFIRYYTNRRCLTIFSREELDNSTILPEYFILIPYNNEKTHKLYQYLKEKYSPVFKCNSLILPGIFFKVS
jgi:hypothetical protein